MNDDKARHRKDNQSENIALLRRLALNLAKLEGSKRMALMVLIVDMGQIR